MSVSPEILEKLMSLADGQVLYNNLKNSLYYLAKAIATPYDQLVFPVAIGTRCTYDSMLYFAHQTINTEEDFNDAHWAPITVDDFLTTFSDDLGAMIDATSASYSQLTFPIAKGTYCYYNNVFYKANQDISTQENWTAAHWTSVTISAELKACFDAINAVGDLIAPDYADLTFPVRQGQFCRHEGHLYEANQNISTAESWTSAHWALDRSIGDALTDIFGEVENAIDEQSHRVENLAESFAPKYEDLSFPIIMPAFCTFEGRFYTANQDIAVYEDFDSDHWDEVDVANICNAISSLMNALTQKISKPETTGTAGQVLGLDQNLDPVWVDQTGGGGSVDPEDIAEAVDAWCDENITNPSNPPLDRSLSLENAAAPADLVGEIKDNANVITKVVYDDEDIKDYSSASANVGQNQASIVIAPNTTTGYYVKSAAVYTQTGSDVKFSVFRCDPYYDHLPSDPRKKFTKMYDIAIVKADSDGKAEIVFDVPLHLTGYEETVLVACVDKTITSMYYGSYTDADYTIWNYDKNWYNLLPGEYYNHPYQYFKDVPSQYSPRFDIEYILEADATAINLSAGTIAQLNENYNQNDTKIDEHSQKAVRNSTLYNELNIVKTETIEPTDTTRKNSEAVQPQGYNGWFTVVYVDEEEAVKLKKIDIFATDNASVRLGIWTFIPYSDENQTQGYLKLKTVLGTATASNSHAIFELDNVEFDPTTEFLGVASSTGSIGYNTGIVNGFAELWYNSDKGFYETEVGEENPNLLWKPGKTTSTSATVQGNYSITYQLKDSKTVTTVTNVKEAVDSMIGDVEEMKHSMPVVDVPLRIPHNKYFCILVDDLTRDALTIAERLLSIGVKPALGLKMESMGVDITWDELRTLQGMGFEIAFHGMLHGHTPAGTAPANDSVMIADIAEFKALCAEHGIVLHGYLGPNHYPLPVGAFKEFEWARTPYGLDTYGAPNHLGATFASVSVWSCDPLNASDMPTIKQNMISAASSVADNQYLTPMCHTQNLVAYIDDYMDVFEDWIGKGLVPLRPMDAVKQSLFNAGGIGNNSTFEIQAGTATNPYNVTAGNGIVKSYPAITDGVTFTPSVSNAGVISWTNDGNRQNPSSVDLVAAVITALPSAVGVSF